MTFTLNKYLPWWYAAKEHNFVIYLSDNSEVSYSKHIIINVVPEAKLSISGDVDRWKRSSQFVHSSSSLGNAQHFERGSCPAKMLGIMGTRPSRTGWPKVSILCGYDYLMCWSGFKTTTVGSFSFPTIRYCLPIKKI